MFILARNFLRSTLLDVPINHTESIWCPVILENNRSFAVGGFYRPPKSYVLVLLDLQNLVSVFAVSFILLGGDFNLPDLRCSEKQTCLC